MNKIILNLLMLITLIFIPLFTKAAYMNDRFYIKEKFFDFTKSVVAGKCSGQTPYPVLINNDNEEIINEINNEILDFVEIYAICNQGEKKNFSVTFDMPPAGSEKYFSVRWITKKDDKIYRIDSLTFNINNAQLVTGEDILNPLTHDMSKEMVRLSGGHLQTCCDWDKFLDKAGKREIQYYIKEGVWYIIFNPTHVLDKIIDIKIPEYFLQGNDVTGTR